MRPWTLSRDTSTTKLVARLHLPCALPSKALELTEPERTKRWLVECFVADPVDTLHQQALSEFYRLAI